MIDVASHFYHEKRVAWVSIPMHACDPVPIVMGLRLAALRAAGAPLSTLSSFWCPFRQRAPQHRRNLQQNGTTFSHREIPGDSHRNFRGFFLNGKHPVSLRG